VIPFPPRLCIAAFVVAVSGCALARGPALPTPREDVVTAADLAHVTDAANLLRAVRELRPLRLERQSFEAFDSTRAEPVVIYLDGLRLGGPDHLRYIALENVARVRYLDADQAEARYGSGYLNGAIEVTSVK
jgi:hypothetical protein